MNHARIAQQALHYRNAMVADSFTAGRFDPAAVATVALVLMTMMIGLRLTDEGVSRQGLRARFGVDMKNLIGKCFDRFNIIHRHVFSVKSMLKSMLLIL